MCTRYNIRCTCSSMWTLFLLCLSVVPVFAQQGRKVDSKQIFFVKTSAASSWKDIAHHLGFDFDTIEVFDMKSRDPRDSCWEMLHEWTKQKKSAATEEELYRALVAAERMDIAEKLQDKRKPDNEDEDSYQPGYTAAWNADKECARRNIYAAATETEYCMPRIQPDIDTTAQVESFRESLSLRYSFLRVLKPLTWDPRFTLELDEIFTELELVKVQENEILRQPLQSMDDVFDSHICPGPHVVIGEAGSGKSTLFSKLAFDWSKARGKLAVMKKYVLLIRLREVKPGESIAGIVWDQCVTKSAKGVSIKLIERYLREHESDLVFLLDGYDELPQGANTIPELLDGIWYPGSTVVVTSRPGIEIDMGMPVDCTVKILGFSPDHVEQYMTKYFKAVGKPELATSLVKAVQADIVAKSLIQNPMFVMLLCVLWEEDPTRVFPGTISGLYQELLTCLVRKYCKREDIAMLDDELPVFISDALLLLGEHAFKSLKKDQVSIDLDRTATLLKRDTGILLKLGIVSKEVSASRLHPRVQLNFPHKTMQEFLASRYIAHKLSSSEDDIEKYLNLESEFAAIRQDSLLQFTCGSLGDPASRMVLEKLHQLIPKREFTFSERRTPFAFAERFNIFELCLVCLHERQDPSLIPIFKGSLSLTDAYLSIRVPSRQGAALLFYLAHAEGMPLSRVLNLTLVFKCQIGYDLEDLTPLLRNVPNLRVLKLVNASLTEKSMEALKQDLPHVWMLEELDLKNSLNKKIGDDGIRKLSEGLGNILNLKRLRLIHVGMSDTGLSVLAQALKQLSSLRLLDLAGNRIGDAGCQLLFSILHDLNLETLRLDHNSIGNDGLETFSVMQGLIPNLKTLQLYDNKMLDITLQSLAANLYRLPSLQTLNIAFNIVTGEGIVNFAQTIGRMTALEELDILPWKKVHLDNTQAMAIATMLGRLPVLRQLLLMHTSMEAAGFQALMEAAREHPTLKEIVYSSDLVPKGVDTKFGFLTLQQPLNADYIRQRRRVRDEDSDEDLLEILGWKTVEILKTRL